MNKYRNATYYVYFNFKSDHVQINDYDSFVDRFNLDQYSRKYKNNRQFENERPTEKEMNEILAKYIDNESITRTYDGHSGIDNGFIWMTFLKSREGQEWEEITKFMDIAHQVGYETNLTVSSPRCNVDWH